MFPAILSPRNQTERTVSPPTSRSNVPAKAVCLQPKLSPAILCRRNQTARPLSPPPSPSNIAAEPVSLNLSLYLHLRLFLTFRLTFMQPLINSTNVSASVKTPSPNITTKVHGSLIMEFIANGGLVPLWARPWMVKSSTLSNGALSVHCSSIKIFLQIYFCSFAQNVLRIFQVRLFWEFQEVHLEEHS